MQTQFIPASNYKAAKPEAKMSSREMDREIRAYYGHNGAECIVRIKRDGTIERFGSAMPTDRSKDFWMLVGNRKDAERKIINAYCRGA